MCTRIAHSRSIAEVGERKDVQPKPYHKEWTKYVMMPGPARVRHPIVEERTKKLSELGNSCDFNRVETGDPSLGIIASGTAYQYAKEVLGKNASYLKLGLVNPLPDRLILDFAKSVKRLVVIEELDPIIETHCTKLGLKVEGKNLFPLCGEFSQKLVAEKLGIPCQTKSVIAGGNDAGAIHVSRGGVRTAAISLPCRYLHSPSCVIAETDLNCSYQLACGLAERIQKL